jgi:hypothetical protein
MIEDVEEEASIEAHVRCIKQFAATVAKNAKSHSSQQKADLYTVKSATESIGLHADTKYQNFRVYLFEDLHIISYNN